MEQCKLGEMEQRFADMIWENAPIASGQLAKMCADAFGWKRTTAYTMLKRLCDRKIFANSNGLVTVLMSRDEFQSARGEQFINENFDGSLPLFLAAFSRRKKLSGKEVEELKKLIDEYEENEEEEG
ncbi:MAG: BlaI/MecI/CopY family transcriptional regulator [Lachnospiraceae bacterium]|nr:BlaI/MecI/CopY family transcriptional regulator [Lachnospiraceae bacterium]